LDASPAALREAQELGNGDPRLEFRAYRIGGALPFPDATFDMVYSNNFLECVGDKSAFLHEVARVVRPGGQVVFAHWDWDSQTIDGVDKGLIRSVVHAFADWQQPWMEHCDGWMGRRLWSVFQSTNQFEGTVHARVLINTTYAAPLYGHARIADLAALSAQGLIPAGDYAALMGQVQELADSDRFFYSITCYAYVGRAKAGSSDTF
jgi:SAM-dependent methyltransferase